MGIDPSEFTEDYTEYCAEQCEKKHDYTAPIARHGEEQFACILRQRSGFDAGNIDMGVRDIDHLAPAEQQDVVNTAYLIYEAYCQRTGMSQDIRDIEKG